MVMLSENDSIPASSRWSKRATDETKPWPSDVRTHVPSVDPAESVQVPRDTIATTTPTLQKQLLEIAKSFSTGPSVHTLQQAAQRLAEAELLHQHAVSLVEKMASLPWRDRRFGFNEWQGLAAACELWESNIE